MIKFTVLSALAILIGTTIGNILVSISGVLPTSYSITTLNFSHLILLKLIQEIPVAISLGFFQWWGIKAYIPSIYWIFVTSFGYILANTFPNIWSNVAIYQLGQNLINIAIGSTLITPICYIIFGIVQSIFLSKYVTKAWKWIAVPFICWLSLAIWFTPFNILLARLLTPREYGNFALAIASVKLISSALVLGIVPAVALCLLRKK
ncbi:MAG: hypothetical protein HC785_14185 [Calothrix sp. CSU_2_0]|nr:hypothetical protein [Calothrix sp. CSU_2_0]